MHDPTDFSAAIKLAGTFCEEIPTGVLYKLRNRVIHDRHLVLKDHKPLISKKTIN
jgi:hypothetical protein